MRHIERSGGRLGRPKKNHSHIEALLNNRFLLGSELTPELQRVGNLSRRAASRAIERSTRDGSILSSAPVSFSAGRDYMFWLPNSSCGQEYFSKIRSKLVGRPALDCIIHALSSFGGAMPEVCLPRFIPAPTEARFGRPTIADALLDLHRLKLIRRIEGPPRTISLTDEFMKWFPADQVSVALPLKLRTEGLLLRVVAKWLQSTAMVAWNSVEVRNSASGRPVIFNGFGFDLKAPSYVRPLAHGSAKPVPGFILADLTIGEFHEFEAKAFVRKLSLVRKRKNPPTIMGICFAEGFEPEAFKTLRNSGVIVVLLSRLGSQDLPELTRVIAEVFEQVKAGGQRDLPKTLKAIEKLAGERETNMAGSIFELMIGRSLEEQGHTIHGFDRKVSGVLPSGEPVEREVDVWSEWKSSLHIVEAKGYHRFQPVGLAEVKRFFEETAPIAKKALEIPQRHLKAKWAFYTSSYFHKDALEYLEQIKGRYQNAKKIEVEFMDGMQLRAIWKSEQLSYLNRLLDRYFATRRKQVFDPTLGEIVDAPPPEYEQYIGAIPDPNEIQELEQRAADVESTKDLRLIAEAADQTLKGPRKH
jgi:hypothetical protein